MPAAISQFMGWLRPSSRSSDRPPTAPPQIPSSQSADAIATPEIWRQSTTSSMKRKTGAEENGTNTPKKLAGAPQREKKGGSLVEQPPPVIDQHIQQRYEQKVLALEAEIDNLKQANKQQVDEELALNREITDLQSSLTTALATLDEQQRQSKKTEQDLQESRRWGSSLQTEIDTLKQTIVRQIKEKSSLNQKIANLESQLATTAENHRRQRQKSDQEHWRVESSLQKSLREAKIAAEQSNHQLRNFKHDAQRRESSLQSKIGNLELELAQLHAKDAEHKDKVELAHQAAKAVLSQKRALDTADTDAEAWFQSRGQSWYTFSRANALPNISAMMGKLAGSDVPELCQALSDVVSLEGPNQELPRKLLDQKGTPQLLLHALLANFICDKVIWSPFWFLEAIPSDDDPLLSMPQQVAMENLYQYLMSIHESDAHQWRSSLARILAVNGMDQPTPKSGKPLMTSSGGNSLPSSSPSTTVTNRLLVHRREYAQHLACIFLSGPARFLIRDQLGDAAYTRATATRATRSNTVTPTATATQTAAPPAPHPCLARLTDEIDEALRFSIKIWSGRSNIEKMGLDDFQQAPFNGSFLTTTSTGGGTNKNAPVPAMAMRSKVQPSSSSSMSLASPNNGHGGGGGGPARRSTRSIGSAAADDRNMGAYMELYRGCGEAEACKGQRILVVVQPAIAAVGTEEGDGYDDWKARRIWARAQVFV